MVEADYRATDVRQTGMQMHFNLHRPMTNNCPHKNAPAKKNSYAKPATLAMQLNLAGEHNVHNALAAIAVADDLGVDITITQAVLQEFNGVARRFDIRGRFTVHAGVVDAMAAKPVILVDDYGRHPREIEVTLAAARKSWPDHRIIMLFQPHRYSRTRDLYDAFVTILSQVDQLILIDIYAAGEKPIPGINSQALAASIRQRCNQDPIYIAGTDCAAKINALLDNLLQPGDILLTQGAGDVNMLASELATYLEHRQNSHGS